MDWAISSQAANSGKVQRLSPMGVEKNSSLFSKWSAPEYQGEDIVCTCVKAQEVMQQNNMEVTDVIGIYKIENLINGKIYFGQSTNVEDRLAHHKSKQRHGSHENDYLQRSWDKYGEENFEFKMIVTCAEDDLDNLERKYIKLFDSMNRAKGYNFESGGNRNKHMSEESRKKMSEAKIGMYDGEKNPMYGVHLKHTEEWKKNMSERNSGEGNPMYGVHQKISEERKRAASKMFSGEGNPFYGQKHSQETKERMRKGNKRKKAVLCIETGIIYDSACEAYRQTGVFSDSINKCCNGKQNTAGHYHWKFVA